MTDAKLVNLLQSGAKHQPFEFPVTSFASVMVRGGDEDYWWLQASAVDDKVVLDVVVADILENALKPFDDLGSAKTTQKVADGAGVMN